MTTTTIPLGAVDVTDWEDDDHAGTHRMFWCAQHKVDIPATYDHHGNLITTPVDVWAWVQGTQWGSDGTVARTVCISGLHGDEPLTVADTRRVLDMLAAVVAAAEAAENLSQSSAAA